MDELSHFLDECRAITEVQLHKKVIAPLLDELGMTNVVYCHGTQERGKDFYYLSPNSYGDAELHGCQVKNKKTNARAGDPNSIHGLLEQIETALATDLADPVGLAHKRPAQLLVISTFAIEDRVLSNCQGRLDKIRSQVTFKCGQEFAKFARDHCPTTFYKMVNVSHSFEQSQGVKLRVHAEANAFQLGKTNEFDNAFVNLSLVNAGALLREQLVQNNAPKNLEATEVHKEQINDIRRLNKGLTDELSIEQAFQLISGGGNLADVDADLDKRNELSFRLIDLELLVEEVCSFCERIDNTSKISGELFSVIKILDDVLSIFGTRAFGRNSRKSSQITKSLTLTKNAPTAIRRARTPLLIEGCPGAGKTFLARKTTLALQEEGNKVIYFPCNWIKDHGDELDTRIKDYVRDGLPELTDDDVTEIVQSAKYIVLDGCDEAATIEGVFEKQVDKLIFPKRLAVKIGRNDQLSSIDLPKEVRGVLRIRKTGSTRKLELSRRLSDLELSSLEACTHDTSFEKHVGDLIGKHRQLPQVILTCRDTINIELESPLVRIGLLPMSDNQINEFFRNWGKIHEQEIETVLNFLEHNPYIKEVCRTPISAIILLGIHASKSDLPKNRAQLYSKRFDLLLQSWDLVKNVPRRNRLDKDVKLRFLSELAFLAHQKNIVDVSISDAQSIWDARFKGLCGLRSVNEAINELIVSNGVLEYTSRSKSTVGFGHLSFQEYLAANAVVLNQKYSFLSDKYEVPWWKNVTRFYCGIVGNAEPFFVKVQERGFLRYDEDGFLESLLKEIEFDPGTRSLIAEVCSDSL